MTADDGQLGQSSTKKRRATPTKRKAHVARVGDLVRRMGAQSVIMSQIVADRFGLHTTDLEALDLVFLRGQLSAGELAEATGLTSGSVTALIDRLVKAGYIERCPDPSDRRRVLVRVRHDAIAPIKAVYTSIERRMFELWSKFTPRELEIIADFLSRSLDLAVQCAKDIQRELPTRTPRQRTRETKQVSPAIPGRFTRS